MSDTFFPLPQADEAEAALASLPAAEQTSWRVAMARVALKMMGAEGGKEQYDPEGDLKVRWGWMDATCVCVGGGGDRFRMCVCTGFVAWCGRV